MIKFLSQIHQNRFRINLVILGCLFVNIGYSQSNKIDSLKLIVQSATKDTTMVSTMNALVIELLYFENLNEASQVADGAVVLAKQLDFKKGLAYAFKNKGLVAYYKGDYIQSLDNWLNSLAIFETLEDYTAMSNMQNNLGAVFQNQGGKVRAIEFYLESLELAKKVDDTFRITTCLLNLGYSYTDVGDYEEALKSYKELEKYLSRLNDPQMQSSYLMGVGDAYSKIGDHENALKYYKNALSINKHTQDYAYNLTMIGTEEEQIGNNEKAIEYFNLSYEVAKDSAWQGDQLLNLIALGDSYKKMNPQKALNNYQLAESLGIELDAKSELRDVYYELSNIYKTRGDLNRALNYLSKSVILKDSINLLASTESSNKELFDFEIGRTKKEIGLLQEEALVSELNAKRQKYILYGTVITLILIILLAIGAVKRYRYVKKTNHIIEKERDRSEKLLLNILPAEIAEELKEKGSAEARDFDLVSILFTDFKEFTKISQKLSANELIGEINHCFKAFDNICEKFGIEKIKTIGDSFMAAGGIPIPSEESAKNTILAALQMQAFITDRMAQKQAKNETVFEMRLGIHSGPVVAGIVGVKKFQYDIWGDTVNTASRMESNGSVGKVNISEHTYNLLKDDKQFSFERRGKINVKGKGELEMYFVKLAS